MAKRAPHFHPKPNNQAILQSMIKITQMLRYVSTRLWSLAECLDGFVKEAHAKRRCDGACCRHRSERTSDFKLSALGKRILQQHQE